MLGSSIRAVVDVSRIRPDHAPRLPWFVLRRTYSVRAFPVSAGRTHVVNRYRPAVARLALSDEVRDWVQSLHL